MKIPNIDTSEKAFGDDLDVQVDNKTCYSSIKILLPILEKYKLTRYKKMSMMLNKKLIHWFVYIIHYY